MRRYLIGQLGTGIIALPWIVGGTIAVIENLAVWSHEITVRGGRVFPPRTRENWVESGHVEDADPNIDTGKP